jgi:hypothetical protein
MNCIASIQVLGTTPRMGPAFSIARASAVRNSRRLLRHEHEHLRWHPTSVPNRRSPELRRKSGRREWFRPLTYVRQSRGPLRNARHYRGTSIGRKGGEKARPTGSGGGRGIRNARTASFILSNDTPGYGCPSRPIGPPSRHSLHKSA